MSEGLVLRSWKVRFEEGRARIVPRTFADGAPFEGPGIDVGGDELATVLPALAPVRTWVEGREPGTRVRSLSFDFDRGRALATLRGADGRIVALRVDEEDDGALFALARTASAFLAEAATKVLARRVVQSTRA